MGDVAVRVGRLGDAREGAGRVEEVDAVVVQPLADAAPRGRAPAEPVLRTRLVRRVVAPGHVGAEDRALRRREAARDRRRRRLQERLVREDPTVVPERPRRVEELDVGPYRGDPVPKVHEVGHVAPIRVVVDRAREVPVDRRRRPGPHDGRRARGLDLLFLPEMVLEPGRAGGRAALRLDAEVRLDVAYRDVVAREERRRQPALRSLKLDAVVAVADEQGRHAQVVLQRERIARENDGLAPERGARGRGRGRLDRVADARVRVFRRPSVALILVPHGQEPLSS